MLIGRVVTVVTVLMFLIFPLVQAQPLTQLPPGITNVEVDGQPIDAVTVPTTNSATPEFSGRAELGVSTLSLVVAAAEAIPFTAEVDNRGRFRAAVPQPLADGQYTLTINDLPIGSFAVQSTGIGEDGEREPREGRQAAPLLDIARVVPYPADFADSLPGIGFLDGRFYTIDEEARRTAAANGDDEADPRQTERALGEAGWLQRYESRLAAPNPDNPEVFTTQVSSFVVEYGSPDAARSAFVALTEGDQPGDAPVGDESTLTLLTGVTPDTGTEYQAARLSFRVGPMLAVIVYADLLNQQVDLALLQSVAQQVAERGAIVAERQTTPLGSMILRLDTPNARGRLVRRDMFDVRAGTLTPLYSEDEATRAGRIELFTGTTDAFASTTAGTFAQSEGARRASRDDQPDNAQPVPTSVIGIEEAPGWQADPVPTSVIGIEGEPTAEAAAEASRPPAVMIQDQPVAPESVATPAPQPELSGASAQVFMMTSLYAFPGDAEADSWLGSQRQRLLDIASQDAAFSEVADAPGLADASVTFATRRPTGDAGELARGFRIYARTGTIVAVIEIVASNELRLSTAARLMELQVECIEEGGCAGVADLRGSVFGGDEEPALKRRDAPAAIRERTPEPAPEATRAPRRAPEPTPVPIQEPPPPAEEPPPIPIEEPAAPPAEEPPHPEEATPPPVEEPAPPPEGEATPPPAEGTPPPVEETPPPAAETPPPAEQTPPTEETPPPPEETPPPVEEPTAVPPAEEPPPTAVPTPGPVIEEPTDDGGSTEDRDRRDRDRRDRDRDRDKNS